jgi:hypothetical protein
MFKTILFSLDTSIFFKFYIFGQVGKKNNIAKCTLSVCNIYPINSCHMHHFNMQLRCIKYLHLYSCYICIDTNGFHTLTSNTLQLQSTLMICTLLQYAWRWKIIIYNIHVTSTISKRIYVISYIWRIIHEMYNMPHRIHFAIHLHNIHNVAYNMDNLSIQFHFMYIS